MFTYLIRGILFILLSAPLAWADITTSLVAQWTFDAGTGTTAVDASGNGHTATFTGTPAWITGKIGTNAIRFDSATDGMTLTAIASGASYTVACWIFADLTSTGDAPILGSASGGSGFLLQGNQFIGMYTGVYGLSTTQVVHNAWQHVAAVVNGTNTVLYLDGVASNTVVVAGTVTFASIGKGSGSESYQGSLDDLRLYSRALTAGDIGELFALGASAATTTKRRVLQY